MQPYVVVDKKPAPDGTELELVRHGDAWIVRVAGQVLMSSRSHGSEDELARLGFAELAGRDAKRILVGGLGLGFTLRAALDLAGPDAELVVSELVPAIVEWNRNQLGALAGHPLQDARVSVALGSVAGELARGGFDLILLDVDNGPAKVAHAGNSDLYDLAGCKRARGALSTGGVLCVWSAASDPRYVRTLLSAGFGHATERPVRGHGSKGSRHFVFVAVR